MIEVLEDAGRATARRIFCADFSNAMFLKQGLEGAGRAFTPLRKVMLLGLNNLVEAEREFRLRTDQFTANITVNNRRS